MNKNVIITILVVTLLVISGAFYYAYESDSDSGQPTLNQNPNQSPNTPTPTTNDVETWQTYTDPTYRFTVKYPRDWKFATDSLGGEPRFSIYKEGEAPLSHHVNATQVSIFPRGLGTEGPSGESREVKMNLTTANEKNVVEFYLSDNTTRGYFVSFTNTPQSWNESGYVWGAVEVQNLQSEELPTENPDFIPNSRLSGQVNAEEYQTVLRILSSFEFTK